MKLDKMGKVNIFVEGSLDKAFVEYVLSNCLKIDANKFVIKETSGYTNLNKYISDFNQATNENGKNLIVFDADINNIDNGGCEKRKGYINNTLYNKVNENNYNIFLFPNNEDEGSIETLLERIINQKQILNCFDNYVNCITELEHSLYNKKLKILSYVSCFKECFKDKYNYRFENTEAWDFQSKELTPLLNFFQEHINK